MAEGFLAGYPMVDIKCAVYDGSYHAVDSNEMAFKTAARIGFRAACEKADPVLLEPMASMDIVVGEDYAGAVMGDISTRRGRIVGHRLQRRGGETVIIVRVPYAEVVTYTKDLRSITRGSGSYSIMLEGYEEAPHDVTKKLVEAIPGGARGGQLTRCGPRGRPGRGGADARGGRMRAMRAMQFFRRSAHSPCFVAIIQHGHAPTPAAVPARGSAPQAFRKKRIVEEKA